MIVINERFKVDMNTSRLSFLVVYITYCKLKKIKKGIFNFQIHNIECKKKK